MLKLHKIKQNCILPSAAIAIKRSQVKYYATIDKKPQVGDLVYGEISYLGHHKNLESKAGRLHTIHAGTRAVFVFGNRYAPDHYEGLIPDELTDRIDLLARGGIVGKVLVKNALIGDPTRIKILGYICDAEQNIITTYDQLLLKAKLSNSTNVEKKRAKIILCIGTSMNSGKSHAAAACCFVLSSKDKNVRAAKITGTASLKDILLMEDCGATHVADFSYLGHPSTYMLNKEKLLNIFHSIDLKYGNNPDNYLIIEIADGILQRETAMLLQEQALIKRIHKIIFCAQDSLGIIGGIKILKEKFGLTPDAISGLCSSSPLAIRELEGLVNLPVFNSAKIDIGRIFPLIE
jgi:hypothetical protein